MAGGLGVRVDVGDGWDEGCGESWISPDPLAGLSETNGGVGEDVLDKSGRVGGGGQLDTGRVRVGATVELATSVDDVSATCGDGGEFRPSVLD
jgi:hypothetical protein